MLVKIDGEEKDVEFDELCNLIKNDYSLCATKKEKYKPRTIKVIGLYRLIREDSIDKSQYTEVKVDENKSIYIRAVAIDMEITTIEEEQEHLSDAIDKAYQLCRNDECLLNTCSYNYDDR